MALAPLAPMGEQQPAGPGRSGAVAVVVSLVLSVVLLSGWARDDGTGPIRQAQSAFQSAIAPLSQLGTAASSPAHGVATAAGDLVATDESRSQLASENEDLRSQVAQLEEYRSEAQRLEALLGIRDLYGLDTLTARVIGVSDDTYSRTITIDQGSDDGVEVGMAVMGIDGVVGQVTSVGPGSAQVRLATDPQSGIGAMLQSGRATGIVNGSSDGLLRLNYVPRSVQVDPGDVVITSGLGGVWPKGIVIGTVVSVAGSETDTNHTIVVQPITSSGSLEEVLVITGTADEVATPTTDQIADAVASAASPNANPQASPDASASGDGTQADASAAPAASDASAASSASTTRGSRAASSAEAASAASSSSTTRRQEGASGGDRR